MADARGPCSGQSCSACGRWSVGRRRADEQPSAETMRPAQELAGIVTGDTVQQMSAALAAQVWPTIEAQAAGKVRPPRLPRCARPSSRRWRSSPAGVMAKAAGRSVPAHFGAQELQDDLHQPVDPIYNEALKREIEG